MPCYCSKISDLQKEKQNLDTAKVYMSKAVSDFNEANRQLKNSASAFQQGFSLAGKQNSASDSINQGFSQALSSVSKAEAEIGRALLQVQREINSYTQADREHHEEERRRAEEAARNR